MTGARGAARVIGAVGIPACATEQPAATHGSQRPHSIKSAKSVEGITKSRPWSPAGHVQGRDRRERQLAEVKEITDKSPESLEDSAGQVRDDPQDGLRRAEVDRV